jgi:hypothetical protein
MAADAHLSFEMYEEDTITIDIVVYEIATPPRLPASLDEIQGPSCRLFAPASFPLHKMSDNNAGIFYLVPRMHNSREK